MHRVRYPPQDLYRAYVVLVIAHRVDDIAPGSMERLVLLDVEFHSGQVASVPKVVRTARKFPEPLARSQLLARLCLQQPCGQQMLGLAQQ